MKPLLFILAFLTLQAQAQYPRVDLPGTEVRKLTSTIVAGQEYALHIMFPGGYESSNKKYPVVYVMDSQWDFPLVKSIYGQQYYDGFIPALLVVGVTWGGTNPNPDSLRARDYTPTADASLKQSGGADKFLSFLKNELFPFIEGNYKASNENRTLMGCSFGGLVTVYAMLTQPDMFTGYIAASPAVGWNREAIYGFEKAFAAKPHKPLRLYMTVGDVERSRPGFEKFAAQLNNAHYSNLSLQAKVLENTGHSGTKSETHARGLQYVFQRLQRTLPDKILEAYTGTYQATDGTKLFVKNEGGLVVSNRSGGGYKLFAGSDSTFYTNSEYLNVRFNSVGGLEMERYGGTQLFKKIKE